MYALKYPFVQPPSSSTDLNARCRPRLAPLHIQVASTGLYAPPAVETAEDLAPRLGTTADWITSRTGVLRRHVAAEPVERMAAAAARKALGDGPPPDLIVYASATPRQLIPDTSVFVERELGLEHVPCHTVHATCLSFLVGLYSASAYVSAGCYERVLVVSSEIGTIGRDFSEPESAALLGDGAAAAIVEPTPAASGSRLLGYAASVLPKGAQFAEFRGLGVERPPSGSETVSTDHLFHMNGSRLFRLAMVHIGPVLDRLFAQTGLSPSDIDLVVPHQPSKPGLELLARWGFPADRVVDIIGEYGNCISASMPMALATAHADGRLQRGMRALLIGTGAGVSIGAAILEW
jgi:3-oxoacyl-[acyl-carrier-protein] synthase III